MDTETEWRKGSSHGVSYGISVLDNQVGRVGWGRGGWCESIVFGGVDWGRSRKWWPNPFRCAWNSRQGVPMRFLPVKIVGEWQLAWVNTRNTQILESWRTLMVNTKKAKILMLVPQAIILSLKHTGIPESSEKMEQFGIEMAKGRMRIPVWWVANICFSHCWIAHGPLPSSFLIWIRNKEIPHIRCDRMSVQKPRCHLCKISTTQFCQVHMVLCPCTILPLTSCSSHHLTAPLKPWLLFLASSSAIIGLLLCLYLRIMEVKNKQKCCYCKCPLPTKSLSFAPKYQATMCFPSAVCSLSSHPREGLGANVTPLFPPADYASIPWIV